MVAAATIVTIVDAVVEFHGLIPVVWSRTIVEAVIACTFCGIFHVGLFPFFGLDRAFEGRSRTIVEVVLCGEVEPAVIILSQVADAHWVCDRLVFTCHMIGNKVHHHLQSLVMGTFHEHQPFGHTVFHMISQIRVDIIIVGDGIW